MYLNNTNQYKRQTIKIWFETKNFRRDETSFTDLKFINLPKKTKQTKNKTCIYFHHFANIISLYQYNS